jgi:hypothetical protein
MKPISDFFPRMLPYLPGCSEPMAAQALVDAAIAFCEDSMVLREPLAPVAVVADTEAYTLVAPVQQQVARVLSVRLGDRELAAVMAEDVNLLPAATGRPMAFYTTRTGSALQVHLFPTPDEAGSLVAQVALRPTKTADELEDDLFDLWSDAVISGAMARCMAVPGQPFSDPSGAAAYGSAAAALSRKARVESYHGRVRGSIRVRSRPFV